MGAILRSVNSTELDKNAKLCYTLLAGCMMQVRVSVESQVTANKPEEPSRVR